MRQEITPAFFEKTFQEEEEKEEKEEEKEEGSPATKKQRREQQQQQQQQANSQLASLLGSFQTTSTKSTQRKTGSLDMPSVFDTTEEDDFFDLW